MVLEIKKKVREKILKEIEPTKYEHNLTYEVLKDFKEELLNRAHQLGINIEIIEGGSFGKGTYLRGDFDIDLFIRFPLEWRDYDISEKLKNILDKGKISYSIEKGSRNYYTVKKRKKGYLFTLECVPVLEIDNFDDVYTSTDYSPAHVKFVSDKILENPILAQEIRLGKQFFKAQGLYGAESYLSGFSGHVLEILIIFYGSLENLLNEARNWEENAFVDINGVYKDLEEAKLYITEEKISKLVVVDPINHLRNAASALSDDMFSKLIVISGIKDELDDTDFKLEKINCKKFISMSKKFAKKYGFYFISYYFKISLKETSKDIVASKIEKFSRSLEYKMQNENFRVFRRDFHVNFSNTEICVCYMLENVKTPGIRIIEGPKVTDNDSVKKFLSGVDSWNWYVLGERIYKYKEKEVKEVTQILPKSVKEIEKFRNKDMNFLTKINFEKNF